MENKQEIIKEMCIQWHIPVNAANAVWDAAIDMAAEEAEQSELLCDYAFKRKLKDKTSCGKSCGGCDQQVFDKQSILQLKFKK